MLSKTLSTKTQRLEGKSNPQSGKWSKTAIFEPPEKSILKSRGRLFAVLDLAASPSFDFPLTERLVLDTLSEKYFSDLEGSPLSTLEKALLEVRHQLINLTVSPKEGSTRELDFNIVAAVLWGQVLYLARMGTSATYILREGNLKEVDLGEEKTLTTASGLVKPEDVIIIGSKEFKEQFPKDRLLSSMDSLDSLIESLPDSSGISALVLKVEVLEAASTTEKIIFTSPSKEFLGTTLRSLLGIKNKISTTVKNTLNRKRVPTGTSADTPPIYLRGQPPPVIPKKSQRRQMKPGWIIVILILLFTGSVTFTIFRHRGKVKKDETSDILTQAEESLREAEGQLDWNNARAREIAENTIQELQRALEYGGDQEEIGNYLDQAQTILDSASKTTRFSNPTSIYDLTLQSQQAQPNIICGSPGSLFVPVPEMKTIFKLDINSSPAKIEKAASEEISNVRLLAVSPSFLWVINEGLSVIDRADLSLRSDVSETDSSWSGVASIAPYEAFGENIYLLIPEKDQISRVSYLEGEFSDPSPWLKEEADLSEAVDLAIDGEIYILFKDGTVLKFLQGEKEPFDLSEKGFSEPIAIYTDDTLDYIYILDRGKKGIAIYTKEGVYHSQYLYDGDDPAWDNMKGFLVDKENGAVYILAGTKVFKIDLREE